MRKFVALISLAVVLFLAGNAGADRAAALRILDRAIDAHGGKAKLERYKLGERTVAGKLFLFGKESKFTGSTVWNFPARFRETTALTAEDGGKQEVVVIIRDGAAWRLLAGQTMELDNLALKDILDELHVLYLTTLVPLKDAEKFTLKALPEAKVEGKLADVIQVSAKGKPDCTLYFDKVSRLLVKIERKARVGNLEFVKAMHFSDHKPFDGLRLPTKLIETQNGVKFIDVTVSRYRFPRLLEGDPFKKP